MSELLTYFSGVLLPALLVALGGLVVILSHLLRGHVIGRIASVLGYLCYAVGSLLTFHYSMEFLDAEREGSLGYEGMLLIMCFPLIIAAAVGIAVGVAQRSFSTRRLELQG